VQSDFNKNTDFSFLILFIYIFGKVSIFIKVTVHMSISKVSHIRLKLGNDLIHNLTDCQGLKVKDRRLFI
jgi:hypothetical protein